MREEKIDFIRKVLLSNIEQDLHRELYERSYYEFFKKAYSILLPGEPFSDNWHIKYICGELQAEMERIMRREPRKKDIIINIPFRSAKSLICTVVFPVWCWVRDTTTKFITVSFSASLALEHASASRNLIQSEWFQKLYGDRVILEPDENQKSFYKIKGGGFRRAVGTGGQITGSGATIIICDDPQDPKLAASEVERKNTIDFYNSVLYSRLNQLELGVRIIVQQRLHQEDLSGHLVEKSPNKHKHICIPVKIESGEENLKPKELKMYYREGLFWPARFTDSVIEDYAVMMGAQQVAGQLYQRPAPKEGNMVKELWFDIVTPESIERDKSIHPMMFYCDTAESSEQKKSGDYSAILVAFKKDNCVYICNVVKVKKEFHELVKFIPEFVNANWYSQYSKIKIEPKSSGKSIVSQLRSSTMLNVVELKSPKDDKVTRMASITPLCESRRVKMVQGNYLKPFMDNLLVFPNGKHDDDVDVFVYAVTDLLMDSDFDFDFV